MNKLIKNILFFTLSLIFINAGFAQEDWEDGRGIEDAQIVVEKNKKIELPIASRKFEKIDNLKEKQVNTKQKYNDLKPNLLELNQINPRLKVLKIRAEKPLPLLGNYVELGFGNYVTPMLNAYFNSTRNSKYAYGAHVNHISSKNGPVKYSGMSSSEIGINGDYFLDKAVLNGTIVYNNEAFRYYGFDDELVSISDEKSIKQNLNQIRGTGGLNGKYDDFSYAANLVFSTLSGKNDLTDLNYGYNAEFKYELADKSSINLSSELTMENAKNDTFNVDRTYFSLNPNYRFLHDGINITLGLNTAFDNDLVNGGGKFHVYPNVFLNYPLFVNELNVFGGVNGDLERNSFTSLLGENRWFLMTENSVFNNDKKIEFFGGLKGNFEQKIGYKTQLSYKNYKNLHYFNQYTADTTQFTVVTDSGTTVLNFRGELSYDISKKMNASLILDYNSYKLTGLSEAYYRPNLVLGVNASFTIQNKVRLNTQINYLSGLTGYSISNARNVDLNNIIDLNFGLDYKISDNFSTFVQLNNITNSNYSYFLNYQNKKFNGLVGISYSF